MGVVYALRMSTVLPRKKKKKSPVTFNTDRMKVDMALRGWEQKDLSAHSGRSIPAVSAFLAATRQTVKTANLLAAALGHSIRRYLILPGDR